VRACTSQSSVVLPVDLRDSTPAVQRVGEHDLEALHSVAAPLFEDADNVAAGAPGADAAPDVAASVQEKAFADAQYRKIDAVYGASLLAALPRSIARLSALSGRRVLVRDVIEDDGERRLKPFKAAVASGSRTHHLGELGTYIDNALNGLLDARLAQGSERWEGEVRQIRFGCCWTKQQSVGEHNLAEAIALALEISPALAHCIEIGLWGFSVTVGLSGPVVVLCCCGIAAHHAQLEAEPPATPLSDILRTASVAQVVETIRSSLVGQFELPAEGADQVEAALAKAFTSIDRQSARREKDERAVAVAGLLHELRFLPSATDVITQEALVAFRNEQYDPWFARNSWPRALEARIDFLFERLNHQWRAAHDVQ
jgi:hypothetical protein